MKPLKFLLIASISCMLMVSCKVTFVPPKSQDALDKIAKIETDATAIFTSADLNYSSHESEIANVNSEIQDLITIDTPRKKDVLVSQDQSIQTAFSEMTSEYKLMGTIPQSVADNYNSYFKSFVHGRSISENALK